MDRGWVRELDLRKCGPGSVAERVGFVPGLRSSAAFFTCLRANLVLSPSVLSSNCNTPYLDAHAVRPPHLEPPSPSCSTVVSEPLVPLDDIPPLSLDVLTDQDDKAEGLQLVADSVSDMGPRATSAVVLHPLSLFGLASCWAAVYRFVYAATAATAHDDEERDAGLALMLASGLTMLYLGAVRFFSSRYSSLADSIDHDWLRAGHPRGSGGEDVVLGARAGQTLVGVLVLRLEPRRPSSASPGRRKIRSWSASLKGGKGIIRAWTTASSHRHQGIGKALLAEAVRYTRDRCGKDAQVGFAQEHAHSTMFLPSLFNSTFRSDEARAASALDGSVEEWDLNNRRRR